MLKSMLQTYRELLVRGTQKPMLGKMMTREEIYELIDYRKYEEADARTLAKAKRIQRSN